jgi:hypothetical protein
MSMRRAYNLAIAIILSEVAVMAGVVGILCYIKG